MIPDWLRDKLATPPGAGAGIHAWLFSCARQLHAHMPAEAVEATLAACTASAGRRVPAREIRDAVRNSQEGAWRPVAGAGAKRGLESPQQSSLEAKGAGGDRWPKPDATARRCRIADVAAEAGIAGLADLWEASPVRDEERTADDWLDWLFPEAEWLCLAKAHPAEARSRRREKWSFGPADECGLVVPSPMTGPSGRGLDGRTSHRCLDNTGPRRWLVVEFDSGTIDEQAALHWHFGEAAKSAGWPPLRLVVHSGGKSLHGWFGPCGEEAVSRELMAYAVTLGADPATWNRCQLVRLPGGFRDSVGNTDVVSLPDDWPAASGRLEVFFFDPCLNNSFLAPGVPQDSTLPLAQMAA